METSFESATEPANAAQNGPDRDENRTMHEIKNLIADVEDLVARIGEFEG